MGILIFCWRRYKLAETWRREIWQYEQHYICVSPNTPTTLFLLVDSSSACLRIPVCITPGGSEKLEETFAGERVSKIRQVHTRTYYLALRSNNQGAAYSNYVHLESGIIEWKIIKRENPIYGSIWFMSSKTVFSGSRSEKGGQLIVKLLILVLRLLISNVGASASRAGLQGQDLMSWWWPRAPRLWRRHLSFNVTDTPGKRDWAPPESLGMEFLQKCTQICRRSCLGPKRTLKA